MVIYFMLAVILIFFIFLYFIFNEEKISDSYDLSIKRYGYDFLEGHDVILGTLFSIIFLFLSFYSFQEKKFLIYKKNNINLYNSLIQKNNTSKKINWDEVPSALINDSKIRPIYKDLLLGDVFKQENYKYEMLNIFKIKLIKNIFLFMIIIILSSYLFLYISIFINNRINFYLWYEWINFYALIYIISMLVIMLLV